MKLRATYRDGAGFRHIGSDDGLQIQFDEVELPALVRAIERLHDESGFAQIQLSDAKSSVDIADSGTAGLFFIEQYFDLIYGGIYALPETTQILTRIAQGLTSEELRDLFASLKGELIYEYDLAAIDKTVAMNHVPAYIRNMLAPFKSDEKDG